MITHSFYESDGRVIRYAETLAQRGDCVEVLALRRGPELPREDVIGGVRLFRVQDRFGKQQQSKTTYLWPLVRFLAVSSRWLTRRHCRQRYDLVHVHNIPDFLVFAAWYPRLTGTKLILDVHDFVPEFFANKFGAEERSAQVIGLKWMEKLSAAFVHQVILANHFMVERYTARSARREKCAVFMNSVDERIFPPRPGRQLSGKPLVLFPGGLQWHQGVDIALLAFQKVRRRLPQAEFHIYGDGNQKPRLTSLAGQSGLNGSVRFFPPQPLREIAAVMAAADLGVVPKRADSFGNEAYSTKIMEFMSVGVPVVVSSTKIDRYYFNETIVRFFESGNIDALAEAMLEVLTNDGLRRGLVERAHAYAAQNSWRNHAANYLRLVDSLCQQN